MISAKIDKAAVETAVSAAADSLANNPNLAWIRKSSLVQRAYFLGLFEGLTAIAEEDSTGNKLAESLIGSIWSRSADDTFPSTQLGQDFTALKERLGRIDNASSFDRPTIDKVITDIKSLNREFRSCVEAARALIGEIELEIAGLKPRIDNVARDRKGEHEVLHRIHDRMYYLEEMMRFMALLETHHELDKRF